MARTEAMVTDNPENWDANFDDEQGALYNFLLDRETE